MPVEITAEIVGDDRAKRTFNIVGKAAKNDTKAMKTISVWLARWVAINFKTEGGNISGGWAPFKYGGRIMPNGQIDYSAKLLQDTGRLKASFLPFHGNHYAGIGADAPYSIFHELGVPARNLPSRRMLPNANDKDVISKVTRIYGLMIEKAINQ